LAKRWYLSKSDEQINEFKAVNNNNQLSVGQVY
jgi:hypothetical protein